MRYPGPHLNYGRSHESKYKNHTDSDKVSTAVTLRAWWVAAWERAGRKLGKIKTPAAR